jgi:hypothetical protein
MGGGAPGARVPIETRLPLKAQRKKSRGLQISSFPSPASNLQPVSTAQCHARQPHSVTTLQATQTTFDTQCHASQTIWVNVDQATQNQVTALQMNEKIPQDEQLESQAAQV